MAILRFRNQNAEQLEEEARVKHQTRVEQRTLQKTGQSVIDPPPGFELLGTWSDIEVSLVQEARIVSTIVMFADLVINRLEHSGHFFGYVRSQGKGFSQSAGCIKKYPFLKNVKCCLLQGRIIRIGFARTQLVPCYSWARFYYNLLAAPLIGEINWDGHRMTGYNVNGMNGAVDSFVSVKVT